MKRCNLSIIFRRTTVFLLLLLLSVPLLSPALVHANQTRKDIHFQSVISTKNRKITYSFSVEGTGHFNVRSYRYYNSQNKADYLGMYVFSDKPFVFTYYSTFEYNGELSTSNKSTTNVITLGNFNGVDCYRYHMSYNGYSDLISFISPNVITSLDTLDNQAIADSLDLTKDSYRDPDPDKDGTLSSSIPTPRIHVNKDYSFGFDNCTDDYYIQLQGRFWSIDDIELYKESLMWKYKYSSYIRGDLNDWYTTGSKTKANSENLSFLENGKACFDEFLTVHPIDERNYFGGTNAVGNFFSGYNNALSTMKMLLGQPTSGYNGVEVYVRYFTYTDSGELLYGKWCHYYDDLAKNGSSGSEWDDDDTLHGGQQSEDGLTDEEKDENEKEEDPRKGDEDITVPTPDDDYTGNGVAFTGLIELLDSLKTQSGAFLSLFSEIFSFLPSWLVSLIYASIGVCCFLGIWHFIRG